MLLGWQIVKALLGQLPKRLKEGATVLYSLRSQKRKDELETFLEGKLFICDFENEPEIEKLGRDLNEFLGDRKLNGILHSIAFANYEEGLKPFHQTKRKDFLQATQISSFSLVELSRVCKPCLDDSASVVTIGISSTEVTAENYGYMAPIKSSLETSVRYLAKSFSKDSKVRFNSVNAGPLKTSASAGIPGYLINYLYAEKLTFRKKSLKHL